MRAAILSFLPLLLAPTLTAQGIPGAAPRAIGEVEAVMARRGR